MNCGSTITSSLVPLRVIQERCASVAVVKRTQIVKDPRPVDISAEALYGSLMAVRDYEMYTVEADMFVHQHLENFLTKMRDGLVVRGVLENLVTRLFREIEREGFPEIWDTEPRQRIYTRVDEVCVELGWIPLYSQGI